MKNVIVMLAVAASLSACASHRTETQVAAAPVVEPAPVQEFQPVRPVRACGVKAPVVQAPVKPCNTCGKPACNTCGTQSYTVTEPVEVVYKNVTYTTVYEPKTFSNTTYEKKPYSCQNGGLCPQHAPAPMAVEYRK